MHRRAWLIVVATLVLVTLSFGAAPAAKKASTKSPELDAAVAALKREYAAYAKKPDASPLRESCDYFKEADAAKIPVEALLVVLEKPIPGDPRQAAYVKWQLLSAWPAEADDAAVGRLVKVYLKAPAPAPRYGMSPKEQKQLDTVIADARHQDDVKLNEMLDQAAAKAAAPDKPVIAYRDELYKKLPLGKPKLLAALQDAHARVSAAANKDSLATALEQDLPSWAIAVPKSKADVREIADLVGKLRFVESPPYYAYASVRSGTLAWRTRTDTLLTKKRFSDLHKLLLDADADADAGTSPDAPAPPGAGDKQAAKTAKP